MHTIVYVFSGKSCNNKDVAYYEPFTNSASLSNIKQMYLLWDWIDLQFVKLYSIALH